MGKTSAEVIRLGQVANNPLRANYLKDDISNTTGSLVLLQLYASQALQQPALDPKSITGDASLLPALKDHQITSQRNAAYLNTTIAPAIITTLTDIIAYSSTFDAFGASIATLLPSIVEVPDARTKTLTLVSQLELEVDRRQNSASSVATLLGSALDKVKTDDVNFQADAKRANLAIGSAQGDLAKVRDEIDGLQKKISGDIAGVVISALVTVGGGVLIGIGALATLPAAVAGADVVLAGIGVAVTGVTGLTTAASLLSEDNSKLAGLYQKAAQLDVTLTLVNALAAQVSSLANVSQQTADAANALSTEWASVQSGLSSFRQDIVRAVDASDVSHLVAALQLARQDWQAINQNAQSLLSRLVDLRPQDVANVLKLGAPRA